MNVVTAREEERFAFGPFVLVPARRVLLKDGMPIDIGSRALAIFALLASRSPSPVSQEELIAAAWPGMHVGENNLRVTIAQIRKILRAGAIEEILVTLPNQGYLLAAPLRVPRQPEQRSARFEGALPPPSVGRLIGRDEIVENLLELMDTGRLVTIVGPGGIGKTRVACEVVGTLRTTTRNVVYVDMAPVTDPRFVNEALASATGVGIGSGRPLQPMADLLRGQHVLLLLDNCEHLLDALALATSFLLTDVPDLSILATSREPLRIEEENVVRLPSLSYPSKNSPGSMKDLAGYSAIALFMERVASSGREIAGDANDIATLVEIGKKLEGVPLAIEIAAAHVPHFGLREILRRLDTNFQLASVQRRRGDPRNQTIKGMLDWSYGLLDERERITLRRVALLRSPFTLECAASLASSREISPDDVQLAVLNLASKSLLTVDSSSPLVRFRLLEMTRAYALERLREAGEFTHFAARHTEECLSLLRKFEADRQHIPTVELLPVYRPAMADIRAALHWSLTDRENIPEGVALAVASDLLWSQLSMMEEYAVVAREALAVWRSEVQGDTIEEMKLLVALGPVLWNTRGPVGEVETIYRRALDIAERLDDLSGRLWAVWGLWLFNLGRGEYRDALSYADRYLELSRHTVKPEVELVGYRARTLALMYAGEFEEARHNAKQILAGSAPVLGDRQTGYLFQQRVTARSNLARMLWIQGFPDQAREHAALAVQDALSFEHYPSVCFALAIAACPIAQWSGFTEDAIQYAEMLVDLAFKHGLSQWLGFGECHRFTLKCDLSRDELQWANPTLPQIETLVTLDDGLVSLSLFSSALSARKSWAAAEILRVRARELIRNSHGRPFEEVESMLRNAIDVARAQQAASWELRASIDLAQYLAASSSMRAKDVLEGAYRQFREGLGTRDLTRARLLLEQLTAAK